MSRRVAVLMGGWSAEREVSLVSGTACADALEAVGYAVTRIDVARDAQALIAALTPLPDVVFNALHGRGGEDGCIQGLLDILGVPYTHSGLLASAVAMDKPLAKRLVAQEGVRVPWGRTLSRTAFGAGHPVSPPYVVKPLNEGSTVGVQLIGPGAAPPSIGPDWPHGELVLVETFIPGRELTVGVKGDEALAVTEISFEGGLFDYKAKYSKGLAHHIIPAELPPPVYEAAMSQAVTVHRTLGCTGVSRSDFRYDPAIGGVDGLYFLEINTQPGMTPTSLVPEQAEYRGIDFPALVTWMVEEALCRV